MKIEEKIKNCKLCGTLQKLTENSIQLGTTPFILIGESPAKDGWIQSKRAFFNSAGKLQGTGRVLNNLLKNIGYSIPDIYFKLLRKLSANSPRATKIRSLQNYRNNGAVSYTSAFEYEDKKVCRCCWQDV